MCCVEAGQPSVPLTTSVCEWGGMAEGGWEGSLERVEKSLLLWSSWLVLRG